MFDWSGLAAVIAVPASFVLGILSIRQTRGLEHRISRIMDLIDRMPKKSAERDELERSRDVLVFRLARRTVNPLRIGPVVVAGLVGFLYMLGAIITQLVIPRPNDSLFNVLFWLGFGLFILANVFGYLAFFRTVRRDRDISDRRKKRREYYSKSRFQRWRFDTAARRAGDDVDTPRSDTQLK